MAKPVHVPLSDEQDFSAGDWEAATAGVLRKLKRLAVRLPFMEDLLAAYYCAFDRATPRHVQAALLGAMVLAHRERLTPRITQAEWAAKRIRDNRDVSGLPAPGVYARHNAVDTPALLPDGTPSSKSVSRVLIARDQVATTQGLRDVERHLDREIEEGGAK